MSSGFWRWTATRNARRAAIMGTVGALVIGVGVATATPGSGGQITACYQKSTGAMRVIDTDAGQQCTKSEAPLTWSTGSSALPPGSVSGGPGGVVVDDSLTKDDLAPDSVESSELANGAVDTGALGADAVTSAKILNGEVGTDELAGDAVTSGKIKDGEVGTGDLAGDAVTSGKIKDGEVGTDDLGTGAVTTGALGADAVTAAKILNGEVGTDDLAGDAVTSGKIKDGEVGTGDLAGDAVTSGKIKDGEVGTGDLGTGAVGTDELGDGAVTSDKVTPNYVNWTNGVRVSLPGPTLTAGGPATLNVGSNHKLLISAQSQLTCTTCTGGDEVALRWQVVEDLGAGVEGPVSFTYESKVTTPSPTTPVSVSAVIPASGASGAHTYKLKVYYVPNGETVTSTNETLSVIDLGR